MEGAGQADSIRVTCEWFVLRRFNKETKCVFLIGNSHSILTTRQPLLFFPCMIIQRNSFGCYIINHLNSCFI